MYVLRHLVIHPQNTVVTYPSREKKNPSHVSDMGLGELSQSPGIAYRFELKGGVSLTYVNENEEQL